MQSTSTQEVQLLLLSCFGRVRLWATPQTAAHQAPLSLGFSRQEYWSGLQFPSPMHAKSFQSCPTLDNPIDGSPPGSSVHGIFQARALEWVAISFSQLSARCWVYAKIEPVINVPFRYPLDSHGKRNGSEQRWIFKVIHRVTQSRQD